MQRHGRFLLNALVLFLPLHAFSVLPGTNQPLANFDNRNIPALGQSAVSSEQATAVSALRASVPNAQVDFAAVTRSPKLVSARDGFLSGPSGNGKGISAPTLAAIPANDPNRVTKAFLNEHRALFGHGAEALDQARVQRDFVTPHNGMRTVVWQQQVDGIPVFEALLISHVTRNDELVNIGSQFVPDPNLAASHGTPNRALLIQAPNITAQEAVAISARNIGEDVNVNLISVAGPAADSPEKNQNFRAPFLNGEAEARLTWLPMDRNSLRLCWDVTLVSHARGEMYRVLVDAETGAVQIRNCLTNYLQDASYRVFTSDSPSPFSPGLPTPGTTQPPLISRTLVTTPGLDLNASPAGWINDGGNETLGNNVDAHTDANNDNLPDLPRPQGSPFRVFDFPMDLTTQNPTAYSQAAVVQLFYWNNFMHDKLYELGFTEAAGNFQSNNFGRGGFGNDAVQADAQDGGGFNNANFSTPPDGSSGRMQMYIFNGPTPQRDGDLDAEVMLHEYTHGLSNRRVGGGVGISALQPSGMGEGWSDFYGLSLLSEAGDDVNGVYAAGGYATYQLSGMTQNYYFGIRRYPYCTDMTKNPLTFKDIDPAQASAHTGIPRSSIIGTTANEVHNMGEVWCVTLWDARANLINAYGWAVGNQLMLQLVTDGMNLSPANPTFLQARDAILQAEQVDTGGTNRALLWAAFAKRGMGASATSPGSSTTSGLVEAYDVPDTLQINPTVLTSAGPVGGPFTPNPATFTISNSGTNSLTWVLANTNGWITISPSSGTLSASSGTNISVTISDIATNFPLGTTSATIWFTNQTSGVFQSRTFNLSIVGRSLFENFEPGIHSSLWSSFGGTVGSTVIATNFGGSISPMNSLWFGDAGSRFAATIPINTSSGGSISFYLHLANGPSAPWENVDIPTEGIVLEYSTNSGVTWTVMGTYDTATYYNWTQVTTNIPLGAISPATQFRWRQLSHSGTCCDHWALDDISVDAGPTPPSILTQPASQTVKSGSNVTFTVSAQGSFPLIYQWSKDGVNLVDGGRISGSTSATLVISPTLESDSGQYSVLVTNIYGTTTSSNATLVVTPLDHFQWNPISSPQGVGVPFQVTITAKDPFNATVTNFNGQVGIIALAAGSGVSQLVTFDDLSGSVPTGYFGLAWSNFNSLAGSSSPNSGYAAGTVSVPNVIYNSGAFPASIISTGRVDFTSAYLTAAWNDNLQVQAQGYNGSTLLYNNTYTLSATAPTLINFNYSGVSRIDFVSFGGTPHPGYSGTQVDDAGYSGAGTHFAMDNVSLGGGGQLITITPTNSSTFTNGVWTGFITFSQPATNISLMCNDNFGHLGTSSTFDVLLQNDVSLSITNSPNPVAVGANLTYLLTVANTGPTAATSVVVTNILPPGVSFVSATASQGSCTQVGGVVTCNLGTIPGAGNATINIVVVPTAAGTLTDSATFSRAEVDPDPSNNSVTSIANALTPTLAIADARLPEGNSGSNNMTFAVQLSPASPSTVTVNFATADGTALAGSDYVPTNGMLTFLPGQTNQQISVAVIGDTNTESSETFFVNLSAPANAVIGDAQGLGTILDDDILTVAVFNNSLYVDTSSGGVSAEAINVQASLTNLGFHVATFTDIPAAAASNRILLFPEFEVRSLGPDLTPTERAALTNFVANGGLLIIHGQGANAGTFINTVFGLTVVESTQSAGGTVYTRTAATTGTEFTNDPPTITGNNGQITLAIPNLPPGTLSMYENGSQSAVSEMPYGNGRITYIGWDWYNAVPIGSQDGGWLSVLQSAVLELSSLVPTPPTILTQPQPSSLVVKPGTNVTFTVSASGSSPLIYQWLKNGTNLNDSINISGTTTTALTLFNVAESDSGNYSVIVTNAYGSVTSSNAVLVVTPLDHFNWTPIVSPEFAGAPINVTLTAMDSFDVLMTNFNDSVSFSAMGGLNAIPVIPASSGNFTNGTWSGTVTVVLPALNVVLTAQDVTAHVGFSNPFDVVATNDLALTMIALPEPVSVGANLVYTLSITNSGPSAATGVLVTNTLPAGATFSSATASQGTAVQDNGVVVGDLGTIAGGTSASMSITVVPTTSGVVLTNTATAFRNEPDAVLANNTAVALTTVTPPTISIADASVIEGNVGSVTMAFPVTLSAPSAETILVNFVTANGSAVAGSDYTGTNGTLVFQPGVTNQEIDVTVLSDTTIEGDETFFVNLSSPVNAIFTDSQAAGIILNDDGLPGQIYSFTWDPISSPQIVNQPFTTTITARDAASAVVTNFNGTVFISGSLGTGATNTILGSPGQTGSGTGDYTVGYSFTLNTNVTVTYVRHYFGSKVSIWTDDGNLICSQNVTNAPGKWTQTRLDAPVRLTNGVTYRLTAHVPSGTNYARGDLGTAFPNGTIVKSYDAIGDTFPTQEDSARWYLVDLQYTVGFAPVTPLVSGNFTNGVWSGNIAVQTFATNFVLRADDGDGHSGASNPFHVISTNQTPIILTSPTNTPAFLGGVATFQASALGTSPLSYQWRFNGVDIAGATNSTLTLNHVLLAQAGGYSVVVSNAFGSASSGKAILSVVQVVAWGAGTNTIISSPNYMQSIVPAGLTNIARVAGGMFHSIAAGADGKVYAWGAGTNFTQLSPNYGQSIVPGIGNVIAVAGGGYHTLALRSDGTVAAWGAGMTNTFVTPNYGQSIVPSTATNVVGIAAGDYHSVVIRGDGKVIAWGNNTFSVTNVPFAATNIVAIASRGTHVLAMRADGLIFHWGSQTALPPQTTNYVAIAAGVNHGLALRNDGTVVAIGGSFQPPSGLSGVVDIAAGFDHSVALKSDGTVVTWGVTNTYGRGQIPPGLSNVVGIACGNYNTLAYLGDGSPVIKYQPVSRAVQLGSLNTSFSVFAVGSQLHYQWQRNGTNLPGATSFSLTLGAQGINAGTYRAVITNSFGAVTSSVVTLTITTTLANALDTFGNQVWTTSGNSNWFGEVTVTHDGVDAAQSGPITDNQQSTVQTTFTGPGTLDFWWKVSSEQFFDTLGFFVDSVQQTNISGEVNWREQNWHIGSGFHTVKWTYQKDASGSSGLDTAWLDQVVFTPDPPVFTLQPVGQTNVGGATISMNVAATGVAPISYQWFKFGTNPVGDSSANLTLTNVTRSDSGIYSAVAANGGGSTPSSNAIVVIRVPQQLKLAQQPDGTFVLTSGDADGGLLSSTDVTNLQPQASSNLLDWVPMTNSLTLTNGTLLFTDPDATNHPSRYYRIIEK
jgi:uncharacterized repeat protein (TIGR01451 family)